MEIIVAWTVSGLRGWHGNLPKYKYSSHITHVQIQIQTQTQILITHIRDDYNDQFMMNGEDGNAFDNDKKDDNYFDCITV